MGATVGACPPVLTARRAKHCWTSQQWHPSTLSRIDYWSCQCHPNRIVCNLRWPRRKAAACRIDARPPVFLDSVPHPLRKRERLRFEQKRKDPQRHAGGQIALVNQLGGTVGRILQHREFQSAEIILTHFSGDVGENFTG